MEMNMKAVSHRSGESGVILLTTLLVLMLVTALMAGFYAAVNSDVRATAVDRDQTQAYAVAHAGLEKLTSDLAQLFESDFSPSSAQISALNANPPNISGFEYREPAGTSGSGYKVSFTPDANGNPAPESPNGSNITSGPYKGMKGIITKYPITITARSTTGNSEVRLRRELQTVSVPVFQFGVFSETDLTFYAGDNFNFGGRVHTNGNLFLSNLYGYALTFTDRITAVREVFRAHFSNGLSVGSNFFTGNVMVPTAIGSPGRNLKYTGPNEASITSAPGAAPVLNSNWTAISTGTYKSIIRNGLTGAKTLNLPLVSQGARPIDLIRRAPANEHTTNPQVYSQRMYSQASLRILLSDRAADIMGLPEIVTATPPVSLDWSAGPPAGYALDATHPPMARSVGPLASALTTTGAISSGNLPVSAAIPVEFRMPTLVVTPPLMASFNMTCTGKTASSFTGCTVPIGQVILPKSAISGTWTEGTYTHSPLTATTNSSNINPGSGISVPVSTNGTLGFSKRFFWVNSTETHPSPRNSVLVTCTGYDPTPRFTGCTSSGIAYPASPANGHTISTNQPLPLNTTQVGGFIKIEKQDAAGVWTDVTMEILNLGIAGTNQEGTSCGADPNPDAVLRFQRLRDNGGGICDYFQSLNPYDYWPNQLYDTREGNYRNVPVGTDSSTWSGSAMRAGGVMGYVTLDVANLTRWFAGTIGTTGNLAWNNNGYIVYFSDRRGDHNEDAATANVETAEFGFEDFINPADAAGTPNGALDGGASGGENVNEDPDENGTPRNSTRESYGEDPANCVGCNVYDPLWDADVNLNMYNANVRPWSFFTSQNNANPGVARINRPSLFRRALKLVRGGISGGNSSLPASGLTVATENPVYVQGNYNTTTANNTEPNVPAAILADAVTLLSNNWTDAASFKYPNSATTRNATTTGYRMAVVAGKGKSFTWPSAGAPHFLFGTDGGVGNFLRLLEDWNINGVAINYRGSIVSLYHSRQATGTFKYGTNVYDYGARNFNFDDDFLLPSLLPPGTPMFRDINTLTFRQILRPTQ
jgi:hypothetical protein